MDELIKKLQGHSFSSTELLELVEDKANFITGDCNLDWINENIQEQKAFRLIIAQIAIGMKIQKIYTMLL